MQVVHTAGQPPNQGRMNLLIKGCTWNSRKAPSRIVPAKASPGQRGVVAAATAGRSGVIVNTSLLRW